MVYNEFIADRNHVHMNSTKWYTLTEFVKYLGREGLCKVDETPKGWYISLIHRDPVEEIEEQKRLARRKAEKVRTCLVSLPPPWALISRLLWCVKSSRATAGM